MKVKEFRNYLSEIGLEERPINDYVSRCRRVEKNLEIDLDDEYSKDKCLSVIESIEQNPFQLKFNNSANISNGLSSIKTAIKSYLNFCNENTSNDSYLNKSYNENVNSNETIQHNLYSTDIKNSDNDDDIFIESNLQVSDQKNINMPKTGLFIGNKKLGIWLSLFIFSLIFGAIYILFDSYNTYFSRINNDIVKSGIVSKYFVICTISADIIIGIYNIFIAYIICHRHNNAVLLTKIYLIIRIVYASAAPFIAFVMFLAFCSPEHRQNLNMSYFYAADVYVNILRTICYSVIWFSYFSFSKHVKEIWPCVATTKK